MNHDEMLERLRRAHEALAMFAWSARDNDLSMGRMAPEDEEALAALQGLDEIMVELEDELDS